MDMRYEPDALINQPWYWRAAIVIPFGVILLVCFMLRNIIKRRYED